VAVAYYSQVSVNNQAEAKPLEMLAVVKTRFHIYLYGLHFTVVKDCHALVYAIKKAHLNPRIARWTVRLQSYTFDILHRAGHMMLHVDALSRVVALVDTVPLEKEWTYRQLQDSYLNERAQQLEKGEHSKFYLIDVLSIVNVWISYDL